MNNTGERDEAKLRLDELTELFYVRTGAATASEMIAKSENTGKPNLFTKLRHHFDPPGYVGDSLTRERDSFDYLLEYYSILEIASSLQSLPDPLPEELKSQALRDLSHKAVRFYYEVNYPMMLPELFRNRLETGNGKQVEFAENENGNSRQFAYFVFSEFIGLATWMANDSDIETFQWFLDDGERDGYDIDDTISTIRNRNKFAKCLNRMESDQDSLVESILGFQKFVDFCIRFDQLLEDAGAFPVLQFEMWHFFSYWFIELKDKVGRYVAEAIHLFANWEPLEERHREEAKQEVSAYIELAQRSIANLIHNRQNGFEYP